MIGEPWSDSQLEEYIFKSSGIFLKEDIFYSVQNDCETKTTLKFVCVYIIVM